jgi:DNA invertase Pin-like site-specific DNA recombinase
MVTVNNSAVRPEKGDRQNIGRFISSLPSGSQIQIEHLSELATSLDHLFDALDEIRYSRITLKLKRGRKMITSTDHFWAIIEAIEMAHRSFKSESTKIGLEQARANGRIGGRKRKLSQKQILQAQDMRRRGESIQKICTTIGCGRTTYYAHCHDQLA